MIFPGIPIAMAFTHLTYKGTQIVNLISLAKQAFDLITSGVLVTLRYVTML